MWCMHGPGGKHGPDLIMRARRAKVKGRKVQARAGGAYDAYEMVSLR